MKKNVFITGTTAGIGKAAAIKFAENNCNLILTGRRKERLETLKTQIEKDHDSKVCILNFDIRDKQQLNECIAGLPKQFKKIDILVNNAGLAKGTLPFQKESNDTFWDEMIDTNLKGLMLTTKAVLPLMPRDGTGRIINISSIAGLESYAGGYAYNASKYAVEGFSNGLRIDLLPEKITVTNINPGKVETEFTIVRYSGDKEKADAVYADIEPLVAHDIAESIYWCASLPDHVNINQLVIMPRCQANATHLFVE